MEKKRIVLISHNDTLGGTAIATYRLMKAFRELGHEADLLVFSKTSDDPHVHALSTAPMRIFRYMQELAGIWVKNGFKHANLFKVSTGSTGIGAHRHPLVKKADVVILGWINQSTLSLEELRRIAAMGKRIVWTMTDAWPMTGICHYPEGCERYTSGCGDCPYLNGHGAPTDLSHRTWLKKRNIYGAADIDFVALNSHTARRAASSALLAGKRVHTIPNPFPSELFPTTPVRPYRSLNRRKFSRIIVFGAARLDDPAKGLNHAIDALNLFMERYPEEAVGCAVVLFGGAADPAIFDNLKFPHVVCGTLNDINYLQNIYCSADVVLSTSANESATGTIIEGMSSGAIPVTFGTGGQTDLIEHKVNGYIARYPDHSDIAEGIHWAFNSGIDRDSQHRNIADRLNAPAIARAYLHLLSNPGDETQKSSAKIHK